MEVVGQACNGVEAVDLAQLMHPDVVLMDLHMPLKGGVAATREITRALPGTQVLVLTTLDDDETVFEAVRAGAHAYLLKDAAEDELLGYDPRPAARRIAFDAADRAQGHGPISAARAVRGIRTPWPTTRLRLRAPHLPPNL